MFTKAQVSNYFDSQVSFIFSFLSSLTPIHWNLTFNILSFLRAYNNLACKHWFDYKTVIACYNHFALQNQIQQYWQWHHIFNFRNFKEQGRPPTIGIDILRCNSFKSAVVGRPYSKAAYGNRLFHSFVCNWGQKITRNLNQVR